MPLRRWQRQEARIAAARAQAIGDLLLLLQRKQDVGMHADRQSAGTGGLLQSEGSLLSPLCAGITSVPVRPTALISAVSQSEKFSVMMVMARITVVSFLSGG